MNTGSSLILLIVAVALLNCSAHTNLEPSGKSQMNGNVSLGGPVVAAFGTHIPVPYTTVGINYGVSEQMDVNMNFHLFSLMYKIAGLDFGGTYFFSGQDDEIPTIGLQVRLLTFGSLKSTVEEQFRVYPVLSGSAAWKTGHGIFYSGFDVTLSLARSEYDSEAADAIISPFTGYRWNLGKRYHLFTEIKWHGANIPSENLSVEYTPIIGLGALTPLISLERSF